MVQTDRVLGSQSIIRNPNMQYCNDAIVPARRACHFWRGPRGCVTVEMPGSNHARHSHDAAHAASMLLVFASRRSCCSLNPEFWRLPLRWPLGQPYHDIYRVPGDCFNDSVMRLETIPFAVQNLFYGRRNDSRSVVCNWCR